MTPAHAMTESELHSDSPTDLGNRSILVRSLTGNEAEPVEQAEYRIANAVAQMSPGRTRLLLLSLVEHKMPIGLELNGPALREVLTVLRNQGTLPTVASLLSAAARDHFVADLALAESNCYAGGHYHEVTYPELKLAGLVTAFERGWSGEGNLGKIPADYAALLPHRERAACFLMDRGTGWFKPLAAGITERSPSELIESLDYRRLVAEVLFASGVQEILRVLREVWRRSEANLRDIIDDATDDRLRMFLAEVYGSAEHQVGPYGVYARERLRQAMAEAIGLLAAPGPKGLSQLDAIMDLLNHLYQGRNLESVRTEKVRAILADENQGTVVIRR